MNNQYRFLARIVIETKTPLNIGSGNKGIKTDSLILRDVNGLPFIPGTTIAGLLRHSLKEEERDPLMGSQKGGSPVIITEAKMLNRNSQVLDGIIGEENLDEEFSTLYKKQLPIRQHAKIGHRGTTVKGGKFDEEVVLKGTRFCFEMEMLSDSKDDGKFKALLNIFASDDFRIGSGSRSGFGEIEVVGNKYQYMIIDLSDEKHRLWYLNKSSSLSEEWKNRIKDPKTQKDVEYIIEEPSLTKPKTGNWIKYIIKGLKPVDFMLFGSGFGNDQGDMTFVRESFVKWDNNKAKVIYGSTRDEEGKEQVKVLVIPASSVKGALSHRIAFHYNKTVGNVIMSDGTIGEGKTEESVTGNNNPAVKAIFGSEGKKNEKTQKMEDKQRGNFLMSDIIRSKGDATKPKILNHVSIDRFTGGAIDGALFSEETLYANRESFDFSILVNKESFKNKNEGEEKVEGADVQKALESALEDLCTGMLPLGGGVNRGNGCFELAEDGAFLKTDDGKTYIFNFKKKEKSWEELV